MDSYSILVTVGQAEHYFKKSRQGERLECLFGTMFVATGPGLRTASSINIVACSGAKEELQCIRLGNCRSCDLLFSYSQRFRTRFSLEVISSLGLYQSWVLMSHTEVMKADLIPFSVLKNEV